VPSISLITTRVRPVDWAALALLAFEIPSLLFSQDRANSIGSTEVLALSVLMLSLAKTPSEGKIGCARTAERSG
jgi:hypothetical protein